MDSKENEVSIYCIINNIKKDKNGTIFAYI